MKKAKVIGKGVKKVVTGVVCIRATFNNIFISITDAQGNILYKTSAGACGFSGSRKSTPYAAGIVADSAAKVAIDKFGMKVASVVIRGPGFGTEAAVKACQSNGKLTIATIVDKTAIPHNGCRLRKKRRV